MYKESKNYKNSYDRLLKDFEQLKHKTQGLGQKYQEMTVLYKQKATRCDFLEKENNDLRSQLQELQEGSE